mmetsp:Transcript_16750/g.34091  ORF Transcript_16750/g.34091 Transcript_16750/m.34091 type:complete len:297 (+) Transcript_16750:498-1388(+)
MPRHHEDFLVARKEKGAEHTAAADHAACMAIEDLEALRGVNPPDPREVIPRGCAHQAAVAGERCGVHGVRVALEPPHHLAALRAPEFGTVAHRQHDRGAVRGWVCIEDVITANLHRAHDLAVGRAPEDRPPVVGAGQHHAPVPREDSGVHGAAVPLKDPQDFPRLCIPQPCAAILRSSQGQLAVGREHGHPQVLRVALQSEQALSGVGVPHLRGRVVGRRDDSRTRSPHDEGDLGAVFEAAICQGTRGWEYGRAMDEPLPRPRNAQNLLDVLPKRSDRFRGWQRDADGLLPCHCDH